MDKKNNKSKIFIIIYAVCFIAAGVAELYFMINYRKMYVAIAAIGVVMLVAFGFLLDEIIGNAAKPDNHTNLDEIIRLQKAIYLNGRNMIQEIDNKFEKNTQILVDALEENRNQLIENEKNIAKVVIKKNLGKAESQPDDKAIESAKNEIIEMLGKLSESIQNIAKLEDLNSIKAQLSGEITDMLGSYINNNSVEQVAATDNSDSEEEVLPESDDPNKQLSPDEIAALFASVQ